HEVEVGIDGTRKSKTIRRLSGDQLVLPIRDPPKKVNWTGFEASRSHTQTSELPERPDKKAMYLPSGEMCGSRSPRLEEMSLVAGPAGLACLPNSSRQMLLLLLTWA